MRGKDLVERLMREKDWTIFSQDGDKAIMLHTTTGQMLPIDLTATIEAEEILRILKRIDSQTRDE